MITITDLEFSNFFSYGKDNKVILNNNPVTQIVGKNANGKSSIPLVIEEILYSRNSKGIKKADIPNRNLDANALVARLRFSKDGVSYEIRLRRTSTISLQVLREGVDISNHTATETLKLIEEIFGLDYKTFTQLIYQSSTSNLQFLDATDSDRKKFLINLFSLDKYTEYHERFKASHKELMLRAAGAKGKVDALTQSIATLENSLKNKVLVELKALPVCELPAAEMQALNVRLLELNKHLTLHRLKDNIESDLMKLTNKYDFNNIPVATFNLANIEASILNLSRDISEMKKSLNTLRERGTTKKCPTCKQVIKAGEDLDTLIADTTAKLATAEKQYAEENSKLLLAKQEKIRVDDYQRALLSKQTFEKQLSEFSNLQVSGVIESEISTINSRLKEIDEEQRTCLKRLSEVNAFNKNAEINNATIMNSRQSYEDLIFNREENAIMLLRLEREVYLFDILKQAFSNYGLTSFKLEYLIKGLEYKINEYLEEMTYGKFSLSFVMTNKDKLDIVVYDNEEPITMSALSAGERARVNISTLLAIRGIMSSISSTKINLLFLDEITGVLDEEGKERLVTILLNEVDLNTFLVSHDYTHPLIPKLIINKENGISYIEG
jgi:DNA repair exonuclease SbcCD ATPase subunit